MERKNYFWLIITVLIILSITIGSLVKPATLPIKSFNLSDKVIHSVAYFLLSISCFLVIPVSKNVKKYIVISVFVILYGILIEILQELLTSTRQADYLDAIANTIGVVFAFMLFLAFCKKKVIN